MQVAVLHIYKFDGKGCKGNVSDVDRMPSQPGMLSLMGQPSTVQGCLQSPFPVTHSTRFVLPTDCKSLLGDEAKSQFILTERDTRRGRATPSAMSATEDDSGP